MLVADAETITKVRVLEQHDVKLVSHHVGGQLQRSLQDVINHCFGGSLHFRLLATAAMHENETQIERRVSANCQRVNADCSYAE